MLCVMPLLLSMSVAAPLKAEEAIQPTVHEMVTCGSSAGCSDGACKIYDVSGISGVPPDTKMCACCLWDDPCDGCSFYFPGDKKEKAKVKQLFIAKAHVAPTVHEMVTCGSTAGCYQACQKADLSFLPGGKANSCMCCLWADPCDGCP